MATSRSEVGYLILSHDEISMIEVPGDYMGCTSSLPLLVAVSISSPPAGDRRSPQQHRRPWTPQLSEIKDFVLS
ncbi:unnamed protein product [Lactuca virosa]|uniref:Uncharacterized protein n=1 Tax=Lactuca virosa TaxID=75947 RepID=A0AAU9NE15_9ASTR|nr:unnamed protein product [Lactuca virosa]